MSIAKVIEVIAEGRTIEEAMQSALKEASKTITNIRQIDIDHIHAKVENGKIIKYRVDARVSFLVRQAA